MKDVSATFTLDVVDEEAMSRIFASGPTYVTIYGPAELPWYKALLVRLLRRPWPEVLVYHGEVFESTITEPSPPGTIVVTMTAGGVMKVRLPDGREE